MKFRNKKSEENNYEIIIEKRISLNKLLDEEVYEVGYLEGNKDFILAHYTGFSGWESLALINSWGEVCFKGIYSVESYNKKKGHILITVKQPDALSDELVGYHGLNRAETYFGVIDLWVEWLRFSEKE
ncbi:MAG: hypothetical protein IPO04_09935 [Cytophagaceae bacterium]|nr:hypothetical protein [Cytophagaceae bacterium]